MQYNPSIPNRTLYDCKKCGAKHGMGIEDMATGTIEPIDLCGNCLMIGTCKPITHQVHLNADDMPEIVDPEALQKELGETLLKILGENYGNMHASETTRLRK